MGRVAGAYGVRGWIKVVPGGGVAQSLAGIQEWWVGDHAYRIVEARVHGATVVASLAEIESREQALRLKGARVCIARDALPEAGAGHYYLDRKSTRLNSSHSSISYAVFCLKKKKTKHISTDSTLSSVPDI